MNTTANQSPSQEQDDYILNFLEWLNKNFEHVGIDEYLDTTDPREYRLQTKYTSANCLQLYRKQQLPSLPSLSYNLITQSSVDIEETAKRNRILFSGYQKLLHYLATSADCHPQDIKNIILDVLDQIS